MAVAYDTATEHIRDADPDTFSHGGAASGVKGVVVAICNLSSATDVVTAVSYGGVALTEINRATDTASEPGSAELWFLGASVPQGTQTVSWSNSGTANAMWACCVTLTGAADLEVIDFDSLNENQADPSVTLSYSGKTAISLASLFTGLASPASFTENGNCTRVHDATDGTKSCLMLRQTTPGTSDFAIGGTSSSDDLAYVAIAVSEVAGGGGADNSLAWCVA